MTSKEVIAKRLEKDFAQMTWRCKGCSFFSESSHRCDGISVNCLFESRLDYVRAAIDVEEVQLGEREFRGERCLAEAVDWAAEQIIRFRDYYVGDPQRPMDAYRPRAFREYKLLCRDYAEQYKTAVKPPKEETT